MTNIIIIIDIFKPSLWEDIDLKSAHDRKRHTFKLISRIQGVKLLIDEIGIEHTEISNIEIDAKLENNEKYFISNTNLKIYRKLDCDLGKQKNNKNQIFFNLEQVILYYGYRPREYYTIIEFKEFKEWKSK